MFECSGRQLRNLIDHWIIQLLTVWIKRSVKRFTEFATQDIPHHFERRS
jgi:hypothetical protein